MNKAQLVETISQKTETKKQAQDIIDMIMDSIKGSLKNSEDVAIAGLGSFKVKKTKARTGRNPKTGETIQIPAKNKVSFKPSKELKELVA